MQDTATELTPKQAKVLLSLVSGRSIEDAATDAGVNPSTVHRWLKESLFEEEYRAARRSVVTQATATIQAACGDAVATLRSIANDADAPASSRVSAARVILDNRCAICRSQVPR